MNRTPIDWALNPDGTPGHTWNPITGCLNGCEYCYARKLANGRLKSRYLANKNIAPFNFSSYESLCVLDKANKADPFYLRFWSDRFSSMLVETLNAKPRGIFVCDMSDLFGIGVPEKWTATVLGAIIARPKHRFYLLTKQPQNLIKWSPFPDNCWVGVTATDNYMFKDAMKGLIDIQAKVKYISFEPLLSEVFVDPISFKGFYEYANMPNTLIDWVIIGAQTKPYKPPKIEWVEEIIEACDKAGIPVFLKDNLIPMLKQVDYILPTNIAMGAALRQEMPEGR